jgi:hypothetical protein
MRNRPQPESRSCTPDVVVVRGLSGLFVMLGKVPGGFAVRPLCGGDKFVVGTRRVLRPSDEDLLARYSGISDSARATAIAHTMIRRNRYSVFNRGRRKRERFERDGH